VSHRTLLFALDVCLMLFLVCYYTLHFRCEPSYPAIRLGRLSDVILSLLHFASQYLTLHGRLVFWLPVHKPRYSTLFMLYFKLACYIIAAILININKRNLARRFSYWSFSLSFLLSVCLSVCLSHCLSVCLSYCLSVLFVYLSILLFIRSAVRCFFYLFYSFIRSFIRLFVYSFIHSFIYLFSFLFFY
jgi:hypothetical protein